MIDDYLCLAEDSGSVYIIDLGNIQFAPGPTHVTVPELNTTYKPVAVTIGNKTVSIGVPQNVSEFSISLYNLQGRVIQKVSRQSTDGYTFKSSGLSRGLYMLRVKAGDFMETKRILVK